MKIKILVAVVGILFSISQIGGVYAGSCSKKCKPPQKFKKYCNKIKQAASGGGGGGGGSENSGKFKLYEKGLKKKHMDEGFRMHAPKAYQDTYKVCEEGIKKLDQQCNANSSSEACHKRNAYMQEMNQIFQAFNSRTNKPNDLLGTGEDDYISKKDIVKSLREENDPKNWKMCKDKESRDKNGLTDPRETAKGMQNKKDSPTSSEFKSKRVAKPSKDSNPNEQNVPWDCDNKEKEGKNNPPKLAMSPSTSHLAYLQNLFLGESFAAGGKQRDFFKNLGERFQKGMKGNYGQRVLNKYNPNEIHSNRGSIGGGFINELQSSFDQYSEMKKNQGRLSNDIQGEGMAATQERFEKSMDMHKNSIKELQKSLEAIAFMCQNQAASTKCFGDSNTLPQLPFPFGGAGGGGGGGDGDDTSVDAEDYPFVARYFCPDKDEDFSLKTKKGIWGSAVVVSPKGITISHKRPLQGFEFHEDGCLVSIADEDSPEKFQIYKSEPRFYTSKSGHKYDLMFFLPKSPHKEDNIVYGVEPEKRDFEHLFTYLEEHQNECTPYKLDLGQFVTAIGFPLSDNDLELEREIEKSKGFMTDSDQEEKTERSFSIAAKLKHEGFSGGAIIRDTDRCFAGISFIRKVAKSGYIQRMVPLPEVLKFVEEALGVDL